MKLKILIVITLMTLCTAAFSQQKLSGTITDMITKEPLPGASIYIRKIKKGTVADKSGKYSLLLSEGKYSVEVSFLGYQTIKETVNVTSERILQNFHLEPSAEMLGTVEITAKSEAREIREQATPVSVVTMDQIQGTVSNVQELLTKTSGIKIRPLVG